MNEDFIVDFATYCEKCKYKESPENEEPCWTCLTFPTNNNSYKPIKYVEGK